MHKSMLAVVITDVAAAGEFRFERRKFGTLDSELRALSAWLEAEQVREAVMESTAPYWKPVWRQLEGQCQLFLAQAQSNRAPKGRKRDFQAAERLVRRHIAGELSLSLVPNPEQRLWRALTRAKHQLKRERVRLHSQVELLLEDARIKLATCVSDLLGLSSSRSCTGWQRARPIRRRWPSLSCEPHRSNGGCAAGSWDDEPSASPDPVSVPGAGGVSGEDPESIASALREHQQAVMRLAAVPGFGVDSAEQVLAEVGPQAATFDSPGQMASWVGVCPGREESAEVSTSDRSPKGNRVMRRVLNQVANAAVKTKGSVFQSLYRRLLPRLGHNKAIWAIARHLCRLAWKILHQQVEYIEYGQQRDQKRSSTG